MKKQNVKKICNRCATPLDAARRFSLSLEKNLVEKIDAAAEGIFVNRNTWLKLAALEKLKLS